MTAAVLTTAAESSRLLAHLAALAGPREDRRQPALLRLETKIGRDLADRLVAALSGVDQRP